MRGAGLEGVGRVTGGEAMVASQIGRVDPGHDGEAAGQLQDVVAIDPVVTVAFHGTADGACDPDGIALDGSMVGVITGVEGGGAASLVELPMSHQLTGRTAGQGQYRDTGNQINQPSTHHKPPN